jgi:hypothetical protein
MSIFSGKDVVSRLTKKGDGLTYFMRNSNLAPFLMSHLITRNGAISFFCLAKERDFESDIWPPQKGPESEKNFMRK